MPERRVTNNVAEGLFAIATAIDRLADVLRPEQDMEAALSGVQTALESIATAIGDHDPMMTVSGIETALERMAAAMAAIAEKMINE